MTGNDSKAQPLAGVRVLDLTHVGAGPLCTALLGQLGAEVTKVEPPGKGEMMRAARPTIGDGPLSYYFASVNPQKRFVQLDLKSTAGRETFLELGDRADVLVENLTPGVVERLGVDYATLRNRNPNIIYCSISGFRRGSAYERLPSFDYIHEAMAGVMAMTTYQGQIPPLPGYPAADMSGAVYGTLAVVLAILNRRSTGEGDFIEVPLHDCLLSLLPLRLGYTFATGEAFAPFGRYHRDFAPFGVFETADGLVVLTVGSDPLWVKLVRTVPELDQPRFATLTTRLKNRDELHHALNEILKERTTQHWLELFWEAGVPAAPVMDTAEVARDPYVKELATELEVEGGTYSWIGYPVVHGGIEASITRAPQRAGADTDAVLRDLRAAFGEDADVTARAAPGPGEQPGGPTGGRA